MSSARGPIQRTRIALLQWGALLQKGFAGGVLPVVKHMPGHGRAFSDTHGTGPRWCTASELVAHDFVPFKALNDLPMAMTAHVIF